MEHCSIVQKPLKMHCRGIVCYTPSSDVRKSLNNVHRKVNVMVQCGGVRRAESSVQAAPLMKCSSTQTPKEPLGQIDVHEIEAVIYHLQNHPGSLSETTKSCLLKEAEDIYNQSMDLASRWNILRGCTHLLMHNDMSLKPTADVLDQIETESHFGRENDTFEKHDTCTVLDKGNVETKRHVTDTASPRSDNEQNHHVAGCEAVDTLLEAPSDFDSNLVSNQMNNDSLQLTTNSVNNTVNNPVTRPPSTGMINSEVSGPLSIDPLARSSTPHYYRPLVIPVPATFVNVQTPCGFATSFPSTSHGFEQIVGTLSREPELTQQVASLLVKQWPQLCTNAVHLQLATYNELVIIEQIRRNGSSKCVNAGSSSLPLKADNISTPCTGAFYQSSSNHGGVPVAGCGAPLQSLSAQAPAAKSSSVISKVGPEHGSTSLSLQNARDSSYLYHQPCQHNTF